MPFSPISSKWDNINLIKPSAACAALSVFVKRIGVSNVYSSSIWTSPIDLPNPLITWQHARVFSLNQLKGLGRIAVTPVWTSPSTNVVCPTKTPSTSVIEFLSPVFIQHLISGLIIP